MKFDNRSPFSLCVVILLLVGIAARGHAQSSGSDQRLEDRISLSTHGTILFNGMSYSPESVSRLLKKSQFVYFCPDRVDDSTQILQVLSLLSQSGIPSENMCICLNYSTSAVIQGDLFDLVDLSGTSPDEMLESITVQSNGIAYLNGIETSVSNLATQVAEGRNIELKCDYNVGIEQLCEVMASVNTSNIVSCTFSPETEILIEIELAPVDESSLDQKMASRVITICGYKTQFRLTPREDVPSFPRFPYFLMQELDQESLYLDNAMFSLQAFIFAKQIRLIGSGYISKEISQQELFKIEGESMYSYCKSQTIVPVYALLSPGETEAEYPVTLYNGQRYHLKITAQPIDKHGMPIEL